MKVDSNNVNAIIGKFPKLNMSKNEKEEKCETISEHSSGKGKFLKKVGVAAAALALLSGTGGCICLDGYYYNPYPVTPCGPVFAPSPVIVIPGGVLDYSPVFVAPFPPGPFIFGGCW